MPAFLAHITGTPVDPAAGTAGLRTLGTGATQAAAGDHAHTKADVGLGNVDNTSNATERAATRTLTNARVTKRVGTTASSSTPTASWDDHDQYNVTALAAGATFGAATGTPTDGQMLLYRVKDNGTARTLAWNAVFRAIGVDLPTTTVISKTLYVGTVWNAADSKADVIAIGQEA